MNLCPCPPGSSTRNWFTTRNSFRSGCSQSMNRTVRSRPWSHPSTPSTVVPVADGHELDTLVVHGGRRRAVERLDDRGVQLAVCGAARRQHGAADPAAYIVAYVRVWTVVGGMIVHSRGSISVRPRLVWLHRSGPLCLSAVTVVRCTHDIHGHRGIKHADQHQLALIAWQTTSAPGSRPICALPPICGSASRAASCGRGTRCRRSAGSPRSGVAPRPQPPS